VRARAPELASRRAQATQSAAGTAPDRLEARSAALSFEQTRIALGPSRVDAGISFGTA
jgi:hypothetical protein